MGAAGLSDALGKHLATRTTKPVLAVIGSMSSSAQQQIALLTRQRSIVLIDIDIT